MYHFLKQFQGMLQVTLRNSPSGQPIDDNEVRRKFQQFGDVKSVTSVGDLTECVSISPYTSLILSHNILVLVMSNSMIPGCVALLILRAAIFS